MSYTYLAEQGGVSSVEDFSDIPAYVLSRSKSTPEKSCCNGNETVSCQDSLSGMILQRLMEDRGGEGWILLPAGSRVRTFQLQEKEKELRANAAGYGDRWPGWLAKYDPSSCLWRTPQLSLLEEHIESLETFPKWGTMRDGVCWALMMSEETTDVKGSGYWATPVTMNTLPPKSEKALMKEATEARPGRSKPANLRDQVNPESMKRWPTPRLNSGPDKSKRHLSLDGAVQILPTPTTLDFKGSGVNGNLRDRLDYATERGSTKSKTYPTPSASRRGAHTGDEAGSIDIDSRSRTSAKGVKYGASLETVCGSGRLNPDWVEWLMAWPVGWTSLESLPVVEKDIWKLIDTARVDPADSGSIPRVGVGIKDRAKRLKAIGNGQFPVACALAFCILCDGV